MANHKTNLILSLVLARKVFGLYLSMFKSWMVFYDEVVSRVQTLTNEEKEQLVNGLK